jgi:hypothetical protein
MTSCGSCKNRRFEVIYRFHLQGYYRRENMKSYISVLCERLIIIFDDAKPCQLYLHGNRYTTVEILLQEAHFTGRPEIHPHSEPKRGTVSHPESLVDLVLWNVDCYKSHTATSYPRRQRSQLLPRRKHELLQGDWRFPQHSVKEIVQRSKLAKD